MMQMNESDRVLIMKRRMKRRHSMRKTPTANTPAVCGGAVLLACLSAPVTAEIYKWVDAEGNVQYTQRPPPAGIEASTIKPPPRVDAAAAKAALKARLEGINSRADERRKKNAERQKSDAERKAGERRCAQAKKRRNSYRFPRVNAIAEDGTYTRLPEEQRVAELKKANDYISENCR